MLNRDLWALSADESEFYIEVDFDIIGGTSQTEYMHTATEQHFKLTEILIGHYHITITKQSKKYRHSVSLRWSV